MGIRYQYGFGVAADLSEAVRWTRKAAEQDLAIGQFNLGEFYANGTGVARDIVQSYFWLSLAAAKGDDAAAMRRDEIVSSMAPDEIAAGDNLVGNWEPRK